MQASLLRRLVWTCALLASTALHGVAAPLEPIRVGTSELPPYATEDSEQAPGAIHEMVSELLRRTQTAAQIEYFPWRRALFLSTKLPRFAIFPLSRITEREHQYRWIVRLYHEHFVFMSLKDSQFDIRQPLKGKHRRIGLLRGTAMHASLKEMGYTNLVEAATVDECFRYLTTGIVDAVFGDREIVRNAKKDRKDGEFAMSDPVSSPTTWLGGSMDFTDAEIALFQKAMREMIADGSYAQILKKYELPPSP
jgi:polar amino acid transport system substrate-binding protein